MISPHATQVYAMPPPTLGDFPAIHGVFNMQKRAGYAATIGTGSIMALMNYIFLDTIIPIPGIGLPAALGTIGTCIAISAISVATVNRTKAEVEKSLAYLSQQVLIRRPELSAGPHFAARTYCAAQKERVLGELERFLLESKLDVAKGQSHISGHGWRDGTVEANVYEANPGTRVDLLWYGLGASDAGRPEGLLARLASVR